jgi:hypothetical protein
MEWIGVPLHQILRDRDVVLEGNELILPKLRERRLLSPPIRGPTHSRGASASAGRASSIWWCGGGGGGQQRLRQAGYTNGPNSTGQQTPPTGSWQNTVCHVCV